jgi:hypothetical protein
MQSEGRRKIPQGVAVGENPGSSALTRRGGWRLQRRRLSGITLADAGAVALTDNSVSMSCPAEARHQATTTPSAELIPWPTGGTARRDGPVRLWPERIARRHRSDQNASYCSTGRFVEFIISIKTSIPTAAVSGCFWDRVAAVPHAVMATAVSIAAIPNDSTLRIQRLPRMKRPDIASSLRRPRMAALNVCRGRMQKGSRGEDNSSKPEPMRSPKGDEADHGRKHEVVAWHQTAAGDIDQRRDDERRESTKNCDRQ